MELEEMKAEIKEDDDYKNLYEELVARMKVLEGNIVRILVESVRRFHQFLMYHYTH